MIPSHSLMCWHMDMEFQHVYTSNYPTVCNSDNTWESNSSSGNNVSVALQENLINECDFVLVFIFIKNQTSSSGECIIQCKLALHVAACFSVDLVPHIASVLLKVKSCLLFPCVSSLFWSFCFFLFFSFFYYYNNYHYCHDYY